MVETAHGNTAGIRDNEDSMLLVEFMRLGDLAECRFIVVLKGFFACKELETF